MPPYHIPRLRFHLQRRTAATGETLLAEEKAIESALATLKGNSLWHHVIRLALDKRSLHETRKLISTIYTQSQDNRQLMVDIIGEDIMTSIENIQPKLS